MEAQPLLVGQFAMVQREHRIFPIGSLSTVRGMRELDPRRSCRQLEHGEQLVSLPVRVMIAELRLIRAKAFRRSSH